MHCLTVETGVLLPGSEGFLRCPGTYRQGRPETNGSWECSEALYPPRAPARPVCPCVIPRAMFSASGHPPALVSEEPVHARPRRVVVEGFPVARKGGEDRCGEEAGALPAAVGHPEPQGTLPCCRRQRRLFRPQRLGRSVGTWPRVRARSAEPSRPSPPAQPRPRAARLGFVALNGCRATAVTGPSLQKETRLRSPRNSGCSGVLRFTACLCPGLTGRAGGHSQTRSLWGGPQHTRRPGYLGNEKLFCRE